MSNGIRTTNLERSFVIDELLGNITEDGVEKTARLPLEALASQLSGTGPFIFGNTVYALTKAELDAYTPPNEHVGGIVLTGADAGYYARSAGVWVFGRGFPDTLAKLTVIGGTANAVQASALPGVNPSAVTAFYVDVAVANTGNVTISINGAAPVPVYNYEGDQYSPGEWDGRVFLSNEGGSLKALTADPAVIAAAVASTSADRVAAEAARDQAEAAASSVSPTEFPNKAAVQALTPAADPLFLSIAGYNTPGDGGAALYKQVGSEPSHPGKIQNGNGTWYEIAESSWNVKMFGAVGNGVADDTLVLDQAVEFVCQRGGRLYFPAGTYRVRGTTRTHSVWFDCPKDVEIHLDQSAVVMMENKFQGWGFQNSTLMGSLTVRGGTLNGASNGSYLDQINPNIYGWASLYVARVSIRGVTIRNLYCSAGIHLRRSNFVDVQQNTMVNVWGNNKNMDGASVDEYGDGIYTAWVYSGEIAFNSIYNDISLSTIQFGRCGIVIEFDNRNVVAHHNGVFGYDRGVHIELVSGQNVVEHNRIEGCRSGIVLWDNKGSPQIVRNNYISNEGARINKTPLLYTSALILFINGSTFNTNAGSIIEGNTLKVLPASHLAGNVGLLPEKLVEITSSDVLFAKNVITDDTKSLPFIVAGPNSSNKLDRVLLDQNNIVCGDFSVSDNRAMTFTRNTLRCSKADLSLDGDITGSTTFSRDGNPVLLAVRSRISENLFRHHTNVYVDVQLYGTFDFNDNRVYAIPKDTNRMFHNAARRFSTYGECSGNALYVSDAARNDVAYLFEYSDRAGFKTTRQNAYINAATSTTITFGCEGNVANAKGQIEVVSSSIPANPDFLPGDRCWQAAPTASATPGWVNTPTGWKALAVLAA